MSNGNLFFRFGKILASLRKKRGWSLSELEHRSGISRTYLSELERGKKEACLGVMQTLAGSYKITISVLTRGL